MSDRAQADNLQISKANALWNCLFPLKRGARGAALTQICAIVQLLATLVVGIIYRVARGSDDTSTLFPTFIVFFVMLFTATGLGNGSTFKQIATLTRDSHEKRGTHAYVASYGGLRCHEASIRIYIIPA